MYLSKGGRTSWLQFLFPAEIQIVSVQNAPWEANSFTHYVIVFKPERKGQELGQTF